MKNTSLSSNSPRPVVLPHKRKSLHNGSAPKRYHSGRNAKSIYEGPRMSRKVHSNINFSELDEVCLDVGKVDLSYSARIRNDTGLSPSKGFRDSNGELNEVSFRGVNGHADCYSLYPKSRIDLKTMRAMRSCYVQLEVLSQPKRRSTPRDSSTAQRGAEDGNWKGWSSSILFSEQHGCPVVRVKENSMVSEVLVTTKDLVDCECKILENNRGHKLKRDNFEKVVLGSCVDNETRKSPGQRKAELKEKLQNYFADKRELQCFLDAMECSDTSSKKVISRRLDFCAESNGMSSLSNNIVRGAEVERSNAVNSVVNSSNVSEKFPGFSERAIFTSRRYAEKIMAYYKKIENQLVVK